MKKIIRLVLIVLLAGVTVASVYMYTVVEQEKSALMNSLKQMEMQVESLEADKQLLANDKQMLLQDIASKNETYQGLLQQKAKLEKELQACEEKFLEFDTNTQNAQQMIDQLTADVGSLRTEAASLKTENAYLKTTNNSLSNENSALRTEIAACKTGRVSEKSSVSPAKE
jgi:chromosome segregation ATPase